MNLKYILIGLLFPSLLWIYLRFNLKRNVINLFSLPSKSLLIFDFIFIFSFSSRILYRLQNNVTETSIYNYLINISYILLGFICLLAIFFMGLDLLHFFRKKHGPHTPAVDYSRRNFFKKNLVFAGLAGCSAVTGAGYINSFEPKVKTVYIPLPPEHVGLKGLKIVQLSDIHIGPTLKKDFCDLLVKKVNELNPDLIVITGDMIDGKVEYLKQELASFQNFKSKLGTFFITGNHEYYWDAEVWIKWARDIGMKPLINENVKLTYKKNEFYLAGINDLYSRDNGHTDPTDTKKAAMGISKESYKILLAHQPRCCFEAKEQGFHTQLSGHTHGGQGFPWNMLVTVLQPYVCGLYNHEGMNVYVHSGTGFWGPPNRFMVDSEIAEIIFQA